MPSNSAIATRILFQFLILLALLTAGCKPTSLFTPDNLAGFTEKPIIIGHGVGEIEVQKTTLGELTSLLGNKFIRKDSEGSFGSKCVDGVCDNNFQKFTDIILDYSEYGLLFTFRSLEGQAIPENDLKLRSIYITCVRKGSGCKFTGKTDSGIHLGSKRKEVVEAIGPSDTWTGQQGLICKRSGVNIRFNSEYLKLSDDDPAESFELFSPSDFSEFEHRSK